MHKDHHRDNRDKDFSDAKTLLEKLPLPDILALADTCVALAGARFAAGIKPTPDEQEILDRALAAHPNP